MSDQEMKDIWNKADDGDRIYLDLTQLVTNLKTKMQKIDRILFFRDAREIVAAVLVSILFAYKSYTEIVTVPKLSFALIAIWSIYVIYRLLGVRKFKKTSDLSNPLKAQLVQQKMYLNEQANLLDTALYWYVAPPAFLAMMAIIGLNYSRGFAWGSFVFSLIIISLISWGIYFLNKKAAKASFQPLIENIDNVLIQLDENNN